MQTKLSPGPIGDTIGYRLRVAQLAAYRQFEGRLARYGTAPRYLGLLGFIAHQPGQPQSRLAEAITLKRSSLVAIIDRLEADGLVERRPSPSDRRSKSVWLTRKGARVVRELTAKAEAQEDQLARGMTAADRATLVRLLDTLVDNLSGG
jgi:DNA-binding MarR family transcriptional regulator